MAGFTVELVGKQANGRDAITHFPVTDYPRTVDEWVTRAREMGSNFDETATREAGVVLGQFLRVAGAVKAGDSLEDYVAARDTLSELAEDVEGFRENQQSAVFGRARAEFGKTVEEWRELFVNGRVRIIGHSDNRKSLVWEFHPELAKYIDAVDITKVNIPEDTRIVFNPPNGIYYAVKVS